MRFACVSDLHGQLPDLSGLEFDALLIGGDIGPGNARHYLIHQAWYESTFVNAAMMNEAYEPVNPIRVVEVSA